MSNAELIAEARAVMGCNCDALKRAFQAAGIQREPDGHYENCPATAENADRVATLADALEQSEMYINAARPAYEKHRAEAIACNFSRCGCGYCKALSPAFSPAFAKIEEESKEQHG